MTLTTSGSPGPPARIPLVMNDAKGSDVGRTLPASAALTGATIAARPRLSPWPSLDRGRASWRSVGMTSRSRSTASTSVFTTIASRSRAADATCVRAAYPDSAMAVSSVPGISRKGRPGLAGISLGFGGGSIARGRQRLGTLQAPVARRVGAGRPIAVGARPQRRSNRRTEPYAHA